MSNTSPQVLLAFVGMPGSGKTEAATYLKEKGYAYVRFGDVTEDVLREKGLPITPENEKEVREELREAYGMDVYAKKSFPKIMKLFETHSVVLVDGLYSWEEYLFLQKQNTRLILVQVFTERKQRYERLASRAVRPLTAEEAFTRDVAEIEKLSKAGPIAIADYVIENNETKHEFYAKLDKLCTKVSI